MAERTTHETELTPEEAADRLEVLARELRTEAPTEVQVGNKTLTLSSASVVDYGVEVTERSPMLGGRREEVDLTLSWAVDESE